MNCVCEVVEGCLWVTLTQLNTLTLGLLGGRVHLDEYEYWVHVGPTAHVKRVFPSHPWTLEFLVLVQCEDADAARAAVHSWSRTMLSSMVTLLLPNWRRTTAV